MLFFSHPWPKGKPSSNRLNTGDKLTITSSVTKDVYIRPCISLIRYHMQIYVLSLVQLPLLWWLKTQFFESKLVAEKISCFEMTNFQALDTLTIYSNIFQNKTIDSNNTLQKRQNTKGYIKEEPFLSRESNKLFSLVLRKEKRYQYVKRLSPPGFSPFPYFQFSHGN